MKIPRFRGLMPKSASTVFFVAAGFSLRLQRGFKHRLMSMNPRRFTAEPGKSPLPQ